MILYTVFSLLTPPGGLFLSGPFKGEGVIGEGGGVIGEGGQIERIR